MPKQVSRSTLPALALALLLVAGPASALSASRTREGITSCPSPTTYCVTSPNSVGSGALISWIGTPSPPTDDFHLVATGCPASQPLLFYYGGAATALPLGNGVRCVGSGGLGIFRFPALITDGAGAAVMKLDYGQPPAGCGAGQWLAGLTRYCQGWYRDPAGGGAQHNLTDGLEVQVCSGSGTAVDLVHVPAGTFEMGRHVGSGYHDELPVHTVRLDAFDIDAYEVSNEKYELYLNWAISQTPPRVTVVAGWVYQVGGAGHALCRTTAASSYSRITWNGTCFGVTAGKEDHPMVDVTWYGAGAYANQRSRDEGLTPCYDEATWDCDHSADGYRLPTEAEWEYAARGGEHSPYRAYPWGDALDGSQANYWSSGDPFEAGATPWTTPAAYYDGNQIPAGVDMANGYGLYDTAGNVLEWCGDRYSESYYSSSPIGNPTGPAAGTHRVIRGGGWEDFASLLRSASRNAYFPALPGHDLGFRVVALRR